MTIENYKKQYSRNYVKELNDSPFCFAVEFQMKERGAFTMACYMRANFAEWLKSHTPEQRAEIKNLFLKEIGAQFDTVTGVS